MLSKSMKMFQTIVLCILMASGLTHCRNGASDQPAPVSIQELHQRAVQALNTGKLDDAEDLARKGFDQTQSDSDGARHWEFQLLLTDILLLQRELESTEDLLQAGVPPGNEFDKLRCRWHLNRARLLIQKRGPSNLEQADGFLTEARRIAEQLGAVDLLARIEASRGLLLQRKAENLDGSDRAKLLAESETSHLTAIQLSARSGALDLQARNKGSFGFFLEDNFRYDEAVQQNLEALQMSESSGNGYLVQKIAGNLGWCYFMLGDLDASIRLFTRAESMAAQSGLETDQHIWLGDRGMVYLKLGAVQEAISDFHAALEIADRRSELEWVSAWLQNLATGYARRNDWDKAESFNQRALEVNARLPGEQEKLEADLYSYLIQADILLAKDHLEEARNRLVEILKAETEDPTLLWEAEAALAGVHARLGETALAEEHFRKTLSSFEEARANLNLKDLGLVITFQERRLEWQQAYVEFLMQQEKPEQALEAVECSRAQVLAEGLKRNPKLLCRISQFQQAAKDLDALLLSYWIAPKRSYVWAVTADGMQHFELPGQTKIEFEVSGYSEILQQRDPLATNSTIGERLHNILLGQLQGLLEDAERVVLVPHGALHGLSFEALIVSGPEKHYWIDDITLALAPSLALLQADLEQSDQKKIASYLMMGYSPSDDPLPNIKSEIEEIEAALASQRLEPAKFIGPQALPSRFEESAPSHRLIHFAAHAEANSESPLNSFVRLNGKLYAHRVASTSLSASLVTVSACRSAGAEVYGGEGLVGFSWAFLHAGAHNVVAGLWNVSDSSSARLMQELYAHLAAGESPAEALRKAKLAQREEGRFSRPRHWAAFQLYTRSNPFEGLFEPPGNQVFRTGEKARSKGNEGEE